MADTKGVRRDPDLRLQSRRADGGFSLIEQVIAMTVIVGALLGLLSTLGATAQGVVVGRQRTIAVSLAKQVIEHLQGIDYTDVAMDLASPGLATDLLITGTSPDLKFELESLVPGGTTPYRETPVSVGTTFSLRTFVTAVLASGDGYRRITVIVDWPSISPKHTMRFSSFVFPLDFTSFPASTGSAEVTGGLITLTGNLGGDTFDDVHVVLPAVRADTSSSTLRTSIGAAGSATSYVDLLVGPVSSTNCSGGGTGIGECPRQTFDSIADNDSTSTSTGNWVAAVGKSFAAGSISTPGGLTIHTPAAAGTVTSHASTDICGSCGFGDDDGVPWTDVGLATTTGSSALFASSHGVGVLGGSLWALGSAWSPTASVDHDLTGNGIVTTSAQLVAPQLALLALEGPGVPAGFEGAVKVGAFTAQASASSGYTTVAPTATAVGPTTVQLWGAGGYGSPVSWMPGTALDVSATATFTVGDHVVSFASRVQSQPSTVSNAVGTTPRTDAAAQHPSILIVTVEVTITSASLVETPVTTTTSTSTVATTTSVPETTTTSIPETTTTSETATTTSETTTAPETTIAVTTTTIPSIPLVTDRFTIVFDYGRVSAHSTWLAKAA